VVAAYIAPAQMVCLARSQSRAEASICSYFIFPCYWLTEGKNWGAGVKPCTRPLFL